MNLDRLHFIHLHPGAKQQTHEIRIANGPSIYESFSKEITTAVLIIFGAGWRPPMWNGGDHHAV